MSQDNSDTDEEQTNDEEKTFEELLEETFEENEEAYQTMGRV